VTEYLYPPIAAPMPDVETERLILRRFRPDDLDELATVFAKPEVWMFPYGRGFGREESAKFLSAQIDAWDTCGFGVWLAVHRELNRMIGYVGISVPMFLPEILPAVEVGWRFDPDFWGQGFATEGATAGLREAFKTLQLTEVTSLPQADNLASVKVCERLGMTFERLVEIPTNEVRGAVTGSLYLMSADEWQSRQND
jgi:RimJ/RimL family protein N-acetyltransferase